MWSLLRARESDQKEMWDRSAWAAAQIQMGQRAVVFLCPGAASNSAAVVWGAFLFRSPCLLCRYRSCQCLRSFPRSPLGSRNSSPDGSCRYLLSCQTLSFQLFPSFLRILSCRSRFRTLRIPFPSAPWRPLSRRIRQGESGSRAGQTSFRRSRLRERAHGLSGLTRWKQGDAGADSG